MTKELKQTKEDIRKLEIIKDNYISHVADFNDRLRERQESLGLLNSKRGSQDTKEDDKPTLGSFSFTKGRLPRRAPKAKTISSPSTKENSYIKQNRFKIM